VWETKVLQQHLKLVLPFRKSTGFKNESIAVNGKFEFVLNIKWKHNFTPASKCLVFMNSQGSV
jgi:hypothetical protein